MAAQLIQKIGRKEFAMVPYKTFLKMQEELEDYRLLKILRKAKADPRNQKGRPFSEAALDLGLIK
jgi:hypothetical protein